MLSLHPQARTTPVVRQEIAQDLDAQWLTLPGMGPTRLVRLQALAEDMCDQGHPSALTRMTVAELLTRYD